MKYVFVFLMLASPAFGGDYDYNHGFEAGYSWSPPPFETTSEYTRMGYWDGVAAQQKDEADQKADDERIREQLRKDEDTHTR